MPVIWQAVRQIMKHQSRIEMRMKLFSILICVVGMTLTACSGHIDNIGSGLELKADKTYISADGADQAVFTVSYGGIDVTEESRIFCKTDESELSGNAFSTVQPGTYTFEAVYQDEKSLTVTVTAGSPSSQTSLFKRNYCIVEFTEAKCINCPDGSGYLIGYFCREKVGFENACVMAFHGNSMGEDELAIPVTAGMMSDFGLQTLPSFVMDMREAGDLNSQRGLLTTAYETSRDDYPARCGFAISTSYDEASSSAKVTVRLTSEVTSSYRVAVFVVEDHVQAMQLTTTEGEKPDYDHRHVVRYLVTSDYRGESWGKLESGQEVSKEYTVNVSSEWNIGNTSICAIAYDASGYVNNCRSCSLGGADAEYEYNEN